MTTVATLTSSTTEQSEPTVEEIDAGCDGDLVDAAFEELDDDPVVASLQADRDRLAALGDMDAARAHNQRVQEMRATQAVADRAAAALDELGQIDADREIEVQA